jgi:photosystem II stability/assembly factor-like uncharacterized protein
MRSVRVALALVVACVLTVAGRGPVRAQEQEGWVRLLTRGASESVSRIVPGPDWPDDALLLVRRGDTYLRTRDGGVTWQQVPAWPGESMQAQTHAGGRAFFAWDRTAIWRSTDDGDSWQKALIAPPSSSDLLEPSFSPRFAEDGRAEVNAGGQLFVTTDGGQSWPPVEPAPGQKVESAGFWPAAAPDRNLYAITVIDTSSLRQFQLYRGGAGGWQPAEIVAGQEVTDLKTAPSGAAIASLFDAASKTRSAAVSIDGGDTWTPLGDKLSVDGQPYRLDTQALAPTFGDGGTLFVAAKGSDTTKSVLFRTDDGGVTWTPLSAAPMLSEDHQRVFRTLVVSPQFSTDGTAILVQSGSQGSPRSAVSAISETYDGGVTWTKGSSQAPEADRISVALGPDGPVWLRETTAPTSGGVIRTQSTDGGRTWTWPISAPYTTIPVLVRSPKYAQDGTLFAGFANGEVWARGAGVQATNGSATCAVEPTGGFQRVWANEAGVRDVLGCPKGPEQPVQLRYLRDGDLRGIWPDNDDDTWYEIAMRNNGTVYFQQRSKTRDTALWQSGTTGTVGGSTQEFAVGVLFFLPEPDGRRTIVMLARGDEVRQFLD